MPLLVMSSSALMDGSSSTGSDSPIEFSLTNGQVMENPSRFNLNPTDRLLLEEGRTSMINRTRYGFLLGATLSPLPLFRGQYAISNLRNLPPLIDRVTQKPNPMVIRARLFWIAQSVVLTTIGSGLGTWLGFKLGLRSMENSLSSLPGSRQRVMEAFNQARQELESEPLDHQSHISPVSRTTKTSHKPTSINNENHDRSFQEQEEDLLKPSSSPTLSNTSHQHSNPAHSKQEPTRSSRWEELRRSPQPHPSTWQTIRRTKLTNNPSQFLSSLKSNIIIIIIIIIIGIGNRASLPSNLQIQIYLNLRMNSKNYSNVNVILALVLLIPLTVIPPQKLESCFLIHYCQ
ncbi:hypothetical protein PSTT_15147 [Puccinia striiformis]|uniref:Uncharacterized protein n=1 Tax=Puccinia striiformis TaxID=27350 RepID=A0A2S4UIY1_9BASI|nr:hypothetical protein PSTT_15147 [Puccinia striiformis]